MLWLRGSWGPLVEVIGRCYERVGSLSLKRGQEIKGVETISKLGGGAALCPRSLAVSQRAAAAQLGLGSAHQGPLPRPIAG